MIRQNVATLLWCAPPAWLAVDPRAGEEETNATEEFAYHRPVLQREVLELLKPKAGVLIVDGTCGGGDLLSVKASNDSRFRGSVVMAT